MVRAYGDSYIHTCPNCGFSGMFVEFEPVFDPSKVRKSKYYEDIIIGFGCPKCKHEFWEEDSCDNNKEQVKLTDFGARPMVKR